MIPQIGGLLELGIWAPTYVMAPICLILSKPFIDHSASFKNRIMVLIFDPTNRGLPPERRSVPVEWIRRKEL